MCLDWLDSGSLYILDLILSLRPLIFYIHARAGKVPGIHIQCA